MAARRNVSLTLRKGSPAFGPLLYSKLLADPARGQASRSHFLEHSGHFPALAPVTRSPLAAETHGVASDSGPNVGALVSATALVCVCVCVRVFMAGTRRMLRVMVLLSLHVAGHDHRGFSISERHAVTCFHFGTIAVRSAKAEVEHQQCVGNREVASHHGRTPR